MIEVELPNGTVVEIETDDPQAAAAAAKKYLDSQPKTQQPVAPREATASSIAQAGIQGVYRAAADVAGAPGDIATLTANTLLSGADWVAERFGGNLDYRFPPSGAGSDAIAGAASRAAQAVGFPVADPEQMTFAEKAARNIGRFGTAAVAGTAALGAGATRSLGAVNDAIIRFLAGARPAHLAGAPGAIAATDAMAGVGAGLAVTGAEEYLPESPLATMGAAMLGGIAGAQFGDPGAVARAGRALYGQMQDKSLPIDPVTGKHFLRAQGDAAAQFVQGRADPGRQDITAENLRQAAEQEKPATSGAVSGDVGLTLLEQGYRQKYPDVFVRHDRDVMGNAVADLESVGPQNADPRAFTDEATRLADQRRQIAQSEAEAAQVRSEQFAQTRQDDAAPLGVYKSEDARTRASEEMGESVVDETLLPLRDEKNKRYNAIDPRGSIKVPVTSLADEAENIAAQVENLPPDIRARVVPGGLLEQLVRMREGSPSDTDPGGAPPAPTKPTDRNPGREAVRLWHNYQRQADELAKQRYGREPVGIWHDDPDVQALLSKASHYRGEANHLLSQKEINVELQAVVDREASDAARRQTKDAVKRSLGPREPDGEAPAHYSAGRLDRASDIGKGYVGGIPPAANANEPIGAASAGGAPFEPVNISFRDLNVMRRELSGAAATARQNNQFGLADSLDRLRSRVNEITDQLPEAAEANRFYEEEYAPVAKAGKGTQGQQIMERLARDRSGTSVLRSEVGRKFMSRREFAEEYQNITKRSPDPEKGQKAAREFLLADLVRAGAVDRQGNLSLPGINAWRRRNSEVVNTVPGLADEIKGLAVKAAGGQKQSSQLARELRAAKSNVRATDDEISRSALGMVLDRDPEHAVKAVLSSGDPVRKIKELRQQLGDNKAAQDGLKASVRDVFKSKVQKASSALTSDGSSGIRIKQYLDTLDEMRPVLAEVFDDPKDMQFLQRVATQLKPYQSLSVHATKGSPTAEYKQVLWKVTEAFLKVRYGGLRGGNYTRTAKLIAETLPSGEDGAERLTLAMFTRPKDMADLLQRPVREIGSPGWNKRLHKVIGLAAAGRESGEDDE